MTFRTLALAGLLWSLPLAVASADVIEPDSAPPGMDAGSSDDGDDGGCSAAPGESSSLALLGLVAAGVVLAARRR